MRPRARVAFGLLATLILFPLAIQAAIRVYVAWFMHSAEREVVERDLMVAGGGIVRLRGSEIRGNVRDGPRVFAWQAAYRRAGSPSPEFVGSWEAAKDGTTVQAWGKLIAIVPNTDYHERGIQRVFVRKPTGKWREIQLDFRDLWDGIEPPILTSYKTGIDPDSAWLPTARVSSSSGRSRRCAE